MAIVNGTLQAVIGQEIQVALRSGMPIENIIVTLAAMAEELQRALPIVQAAMEARLAP